MTENPATNEQLGKEASQWISGVLTPAGWETAPEAVPNARLSESISLRLPKAMLDVLKKFAKREGVGYQVLLKRWLDDRIREESVRLRKPMYGAEVTILKINVPRIVAQAASFDACSVPLLPAAAGTDPFGQLAALTTRR